MHVGPPPKLATPILQEETTELPSKEHEIDLSYEQPLTQVIIQDDEEWYFLQQGLLQREAKRRDKSRPRRSNPRNKKQESGLAKHQILLGSDVMMTSARTRPYVKPPQAPLQSTPSIPTPSIAPPQLVSSRLDRRNRAKRLHFRRSTIHSYGLFASESISEGEIVIEYVGEVIGSQVADLREKQYGEKSCYMFRLDDHWVIDATVKGNLA